MLVAVHEFVLGLYRPPVFNGTRFVTISTPDDHFAAGPDCGVIVSAFRRVGSAGGCPEFVLGLYLPPVFEGPFGTCPPQTIISLPVQTAV